MPTIFYSVPQFAAKVGRSRQAVQAAISNGYIRAERIAGPGRQPWRIPASQLAIYGK